MLGNTQIKLFYFKNFVIPTTFSRKVIIPKIKPTFCNGTFAIFCGGHFYSTTFTHRWRCLQGPRRHPYECIFQLHSLSSWLSSWRNVDVIAWVETSDWPDDLKRPSAVTTVWVTHDGCGAKTHQKWDEGDGGFSLAHATADPERNYTLLTHYDTEWTQLSWIWWKWYAALVRIYKILFTIKMSFEPMKTISSHMEGHWLKEIKEPHCLSW